MKVVEQDFLVLDQVDGKEILRKLEICGRTCYQSGSKITATSAPEFVRKLIRSGHESVLEHEKITVVIVTDRSVTHELVRHRIGSYCQESQRYVKYDGVTFIQPVCMTAVQVQTWEKAMAKAEKAYQKLLDSGLPPQYARTVLPNSTKTVICVTYNLRQWRHVFKQRTSEAAHPQIRELMLSILEEFKKLVPVVFDDIGGKP